MDGRNYELLAKGGVICDSDVMISEVGDVLVGKS